MDCNVANKTKRKICLSNEWREKEAQSRNLRKKELIPISCFNNYIQVAFIHPFREKTYQTLMKLCKDEFNAPIAAMSNVERKLTFQGKHTAIWWEKSKTP